jgi:hypothetical protein
MASNTVRASASKKSARRAFDVEHAVQARAMADGHQVFRAHRGVAGQVIGIAVDVGDELRLAGACAAAGGAMVTGQSGRARRA